MNASTTQISSASATTGTPIPLSYGYVWVTGKREPYYELQNTGKDNLNFARIGMWKLGHGEWDRCIELWINDYLVWNGSTKPSSNGWLQGLPNGGAPYNWIDGLDSQNGIVSSSGFLSLPFQFNFHRGADSPLTGTLPPTSTGPDQGLDNLWPLFPTAINPLSWSRIAYYSLFRKQSILSPTQLTPSHMQQLSSNWTDIAPVGLWASRRCRLFDADGNQTGYAFTTNPAWHIVDAILFRKLMPDYGLDLNIGPDQLTAAVQNRFDWGSIYAAAQYFDEFLANGRRRFEGNYSFSSQTSLQAVLEQMLLCCRSFLTEYAGKIGLHCDMPRASVFTFSRAHILPGSWNADDQSLNKTANRLIANYRDILVPACSQIASITCAFGQNPVVTTVDPHPFEAGDQIAIGGTDTPYDQNWTVYSVPDIVDVGTPEEVDPSTFVLISQGSNFPESVGAVGSCGLLYSRFKERAPEFWHKTNMLARGELGLGIPRVRNKVKQSLDFATTTYDQASRLSCYERDRLLGLDQTPYITPPCVKFRTSFFARDAAGNLAAAIQNGDHVTLDSTTNFQYAGEYEVLEPLTKVVPTVSVSGSGGQIALKPNENSGEIEFILGPYNEAVMYDTSDPTQAGWPSVPGSDPGNSATFTSIPLAAGQFSFFTGTASSGGFFQLPSTGYSPANNLSWAGPAGYGVGTTWTGHMATIELCAVSSTLGLSLIYEDNDQSTWHGQLNYACATWLSSDVPTFDGTMNWLQLTLQGGEEILFGQGVVADGTTITLPAGYTSAQMFAVAYPHDGVPVGGHNAHWVGAYVDSSLQVHLNYKDGDGNVWHGNAAVLVFAWKNNMSTWTTQTLSGATWAQCPLSTAGLIFGVGCALGMADGTTLELPAAAGDGSTLQAIVGTSGWDYSASTGEAHGIYASYLDLSNVVHLQFGDGSGGIWSGAADVFALYTSPASAVEVVVSVLPASTSMPIGTQQQFSAIVANNANQSVTWSVDGNAGGNVTVGTIDSSGLYSSPNAAGSHTITATSVAAPTYNGSATVSVADGGEGGGGWTINGS
jgi:hypothetical protein